MIPVTQKSVTELIEKELEDGRGIEAIVERFHLSVVVHALNMTNGNQTEAACITQDSSQQSRSLDTRCKDPKSLSGVLGGF